MIELSTFVELQRAIETEAEKFGLFTVETILNSVTEATLKQDEFMVKLFVELLKKGFENDRKEFTEKVEDMSYLSVNTKMGYKKKPKLSFMNKDIFAGEINLGKPEKAIESHHAKVTKRLVDVANEKLGRGAKQDEVITQLREEAYNIQSSSETTARTVMDGAEELALDEARQKDENIIGYKWISVLDNRTSTGCIELNDQRFYYSRSGYKPIPPRHYNCRSSTTPIYADNPEGDDIQTFAEWVIAQEKIQITKINEEGEVLYGYQCVGLKVVKYYAKGEELNSCYPAFGGDFRMALGESRYKLYKEGKLKIQRFTDLHGDDLTLEELKQRNEYAWERAGLDQEKQAMSIYARSKSGTPPTDYELAFFSDYVKAEEEKIETQIKNTRTKLLDAKGRMIPSDPGNRYVDIYNLSVSYKNETGKSSVKIKELLEWVKGKDEKLYDFLQSTYEYTEGENLFALKDATIDPWKVTELDDETYERYKKLVEGFSEFEYDYEGWNGLYRGKFYSEDVVGRADRYLKLKKGDTFISSGISSWSKDKSVAENKFAYVRQREPGSKNVHLVIEIDEVDIQRPLGYAIEDFSAFGGEQEVMLRPNERFIVKDKYKDSDGIWRLKLQPQYNLNEEAHQEYMQYKTDLENLFIKRDEIRALKENKSFKTDTMVATIEATPSSTDEAELYGMLVDSDDDLRQWYEEQHLDLVDKLMDKYGIKGEVEVGKGAFEGQTNPNIQIYIDSIKDDDNENLNAMLSEFGKATTQDSVAWHTADPSLDYTNGVRIPISSELTKEEFRDIYLKIYELNPNVSIFDKGENIDIVDFDFENPMNKEELKKFIKDIYKDTKGFAGKGKGKARLFGTDGDYIMKDGYDAKIKAKEPKEPYIYYDIAKGNVELDSEKLVKDIQYGFRANYNNREETLAMTKGKDVSIYPDITKMLGKHLSAKQKREIKTLDEFEVFTQKKDYENVLGLDKKGNIILFNDGGRSKADVPITYKYQLKDGIVSHNHPAGKTVTDRTSGLSQADMQLWFDYELDSIRAVSGKYIYSLKNHGQREWGEIKFKGSKSKWRQHIIELFSDTREKESRWYETYTTYLIEDNDVLRKELEKRYNTKWKTNKQQIIDSYRTEHYYDLDIQDKIFNIWEKAMRDNGLEYTREEFYK